MPDKLTLEWSYTPADFFEEPFDYTGSDYAVHIEGGRAVATFVSDQPDNSFPGVHKELQDWFLRIQPFRNRPFELSAYTSRRTRPDGTATIGMMGYIKVGANLRLRCCSGGCCRKYQI